MPEPQTTQAPPAGGSGASSFATVAELPFIAKVRGEAKALGAFARLLGKDDLAEQARSLNASIDELVSVVDGFYRLLGDEHWVFSQYLNVERMRAVAAMPTPGEAQDKLIGYLREKGTIDGILTHYRRLPDLSARLPILSKAIEDYEEGRFYSSVLVTISVMDGFVNDALKDERRGLHAREPEELWADDCIAAVWAGLPAVQGDFRKSFHARVDEPILNVYRNGILHGMTPNFDNPVVASKAWLMLFGVCDWVEARQKAAEKPVEGNVSLGELAARVGDLLRGKAEFEARISSWSSHSVDLASPSVTDAAFLRSVDEFLMLWEAGNYGGLAGFFPNYGGRTLGSMAGEARELYRSHPIDGYEMLSADRPAPAVGMASVRLKQGDGSWVASLRFVRMKGEDETAADWEQGDWKLMRYAVDPFQDVDESL